MSRQAGMALNPISQESLEAYCRQHGIWRLDAREELEYAIRHLDSIWLEEMREKQKSQGNA